MGGPLSCPALGAHWLDVGFNHPDPGIDLTSVKMIGAVTLLFFITQYPNLAEEGSYILSIPLTIPLTNMYKVTEFKLIISFQFSNYLEQVTKDSHSP